jgi:hypothetical protein
MIPDLSFLKKSVEDGLKDYPLLAITPRLDFLSEKTPVSMSHSDDEIRLSELQSRIIHYIQLEIEAENLLGENFVKYMKVKFIEQNGINLRNKVSHGLLGSINDFDHTTSYSIIHVLIMLAKFSLL